VVFTLNIKAILRSIDCLYLWIAFFIYIVICPWCISIQPCTTWTI